MIHRRHSRRRRPSHYPICGALFAVILLSTVLFRVYHRGTAADLLNGGTRQRTSRLLVVTASNFLNREFLANLACNIHHVCPSRAPIVYSFDRKTHDFSASVGLSSVLLVDEEEQNADGILDEERAIHKNSTAKRKIAAVKTALKTGLDVLFSDTDVFWCRDAGTFLNHLLEHEHYRDADVLIQPDAGYRTLNAGFFFVRSSLRTLALFNQLLVHFTLGAHDHDVMNKLFCASEYGGRKIHEPYGEVPFRCESHGAVIRVLPSQLFPSGKEQFGHVKVFSHSRSALKAMCKRRDFVILRNNFIHASRKRARLIQKGLWYVHFDEENQPKCQREPVPGSIAAAESCGDFC